jgi:4,5-dihydroxyphthalate decarboxylase
VAKLNLTIACDPFESIRAMEEKHIEPEGIELAFQPEMSNPERHGRMARDVAFDICELNVSTYLIARDQGAPITAIPVFLFRKFRHGNVFVDARSGIRAPGDLAGKRVGCPNLQPASNVWISGILRDFHGLDHRDMTWVVEREEDVGFKPASDVRLEKAPKGKTAIDMLLDGDVSAVYMPQTPPTMIKGDTRIGRLFPDYVTRERQYFNDTGLFPIMHVTAIKTDLVKREPWVVASLMKAFEASKLEAYKRLSNVRLVPLAWFGAEWEEDRRLFGDDPWTYGLSETNRRNIETVIRYTHEQGLIRSRPTVDEIFAAP